MPIYTLAARLRIGWSDHTVEPDIIIPQAFIDCRRLWDGLGTRKRWRKDQWSLIRATIEPMLYGTIDPEDVHYDNGLLNQRGTIHSQSVRLLSANFDQGPFPTISAFAFFELSFNRQFADNDAFYDWMEATDWMEWCTNFGWRFPCGNEYGATDVDEWIELHLLTPD